MKRRFATALGLLRSLVLYYAVPFRMRAMQGFYRQFIGAGDLAFDIGAHVGNRVRAWTRLGATVVAVEPQPACLPILRALDAGNPGVHLVECAVSDSHEPVTLHVSSRHPTLSTVSSSWIALASHDADFSHVKWDTCLIVPACTLDELIEQFGIPRFIKVDVEGHEDRVLASLSRAVESVSFEFLRADLDGAIRCVDRLEQLSSYEFNLSFGESMRFDDRRWTDASGIVAQLRSLPARVTSGDVYARRRSRSNCRIHPGASPDRPS